MVSYGSLGIRIGSCDLPIEPSKEQGWVPGELNVVLWLPLGHLVIE